MFRFYFFRPLTLVLKQILLWRLSHFEFYPSSLQAWSSFYQSEKENQTPHSFLYFAWMIFRHGIPDYSDPLSLHVGLDDRGFLFEEMNRIMTLKIDSEVPQLLWADMAFRRFVFLLFIGFPLHSFYDLCGEKKFTSFFSNIAVHHHVEQWGVQHDELLISLNHFFPKSHLLVLSMAHHHYVSPPTRSAFSFVSFLMNCFNRNPSSSTESPSLEVIRIRQWKSKQSLNHSRWLDKVPLDFTDFHS